MKVTNIRTHKGEVPSTDTLLKLERCLLAKFKRAGFVSGVELKTRTRMKIGMHMCSFRIDTAKLGHNADRGYIGRRCKAGFKRTTIPTWSQRDAFNHIVNDCFDKFRLTARIVSGPYTIRVGLHRVNAWDRTLAPRSLEIESFE